MKNEQIRQLVQSATQIPNGDNSQPFSFVWDGQKLLVFHDDKTGEHKLNPNNLASVLTLGCVMEAIELQAGAFHYKPDFSLQLEDSFAKPIRGDDAWLSITFEKAENTYDPLVQYITTRCTDRRMFHGGSLKDPVFSEIERDIEKEDDVGLYYLPGFLPKKLVEYITACHQFPMHDEQCVKDIMQWMRWNRKELERTRDGLHWKSMDLSFLESRMMYTIFRSNLLRHIGNVLGGTWLLNHRLEKLMQSACTLCCFVVRDPTPQTIAVLGRQIFRMWLRLNSHGYGVHPISISSLTTCAQQLGLMTDVAPRFQKLFSEGDEIQRKYFLFPQDFSPVWIFRIGKTTPLPQPARSIRKHLEQVLVIQKGE